MFSHTYFRSLMPTAALACGALICSSAIAGTTPVLDVVINQALDNSPPGFPSLYWNLLSGWSSPVIDDSGKVAFNGVLFGDGITPANNRIIYHGEEGNWTVVARNGDAAPGLSGLTLSPLATTIPGSSSNGTIVVASTLAGRGVATTNDTAFFVGQPASISFVSRESVTTDTSAGNALLSSSMALSAGTLVNNAGQVLFTSDLSGGSPVVTTANNFGVYIGTSSGVTQVNREGNPIPGAPALPALDGPFMNPATTGTKMNAAGEVAGTATVVAGTAGGVDATNDRLIWTTVGGTMRTAVREGDAVPGLPGVTFKTSFTMGAMALSNSGKIAFRGEFLGTGVDATNDSGWLVEDHGTISMIVREGASIDGEVFNFAQFTGGMFLNNNDQVAMVGTIVAGTSGRIWFGPLAGPFTAIVKQGITELPGSPGVILDLDNSAAALVFNNTGQLVFSSPLTGAGVTPNNDSAVLGWSLDTGLVLIARKGETAIPELLEGTTFSIAGTSSITGENESSSLTNTGWLVMRAQDLKGFQAIVRTRPFAEPCDADTNGDSVVNVTDLLAVISAWGACTGCPADTNNDGQVDVTDLLAVISAWGNCP